MSVNEIGAFCFGVVVGYLTYRTLVRTVAASTIGDLSAVLGVIGGGVVTGLFPTDTNLFGWYAIGLPIGLAAFFVLFLALNGAKATGEVMIAPTLSEQSGTPHGPTGSGPRE